MGPPGSGKSTLAKEIAEKTGLKNFDLDDVIYREREYRKTSSKERNAKLKKILNENSSWVIEGSYAHNWILPAVKKADFIIILKKPFSLIKRRLVFRYLKRKIGLDKTEKGAGTLSDLKKLLNYAKTYQKDYFLKHLSIAHKEKKKAMVFNSKKDIDHFIGGLK